ncbi:hypothetical protein M408DRAFT_28856 [Serendipita vermifera MAFF 305830]|uniref:Uncharacterized protein n=1 Tax=Serendipita vermifera MAFF 305830 TaxID=933852 RepID=A0A0C2W705_SERVB|nr:hypothetical protein M408DRAFT_28856 [Serendipita vermifera MAFF 305830]
MIQLGPDKAPWFCTLHIKVDIMLVLLLAYSIMQSIKSEAGPIPASIELRDVASCDGQNSRRDLGTIIWSCLSTIFLCTWVTVHPNVHFRAQKPDQRWFERWLWDPLHEILTYKLPLFVVALLVPEHILAWSVRQYIQAGVVITGWTRTHGHFMIMGGFHLFRLPAGALYVEPSIPANFVIPTGDHSREDEVPVCPLKFEDVPADVLKIIAPTEAEIKDRGKSDDLAKFIVLVQTLWFVLQCIARGTHSLPLTELEVVTLAYTTLNFFIYMFWWDKPRNVECPVRVYKTSMASHEESGEKADEWDESWVWRWMGKTLEYTTGGQDTYVTMSKECSIPMFWSGRISMDHLAVAGMGPSILGAAFGAIHSIAWVSQFPSHPELVLWRVSCVIMIVFPLNTAILCIIDILRQRTGKQYAQSLLEVIKFMCFLFIVLSLWLYFASRVATMVIAFTTLRSLPPAAFATVDWTTLIPHI